jgi:type IV pilus assembly protein PilV
MMHLHQRGFGLVEVAVSLLVLSVATLGLGRLQIAASQLGHQAMQRTIAVAFAQDLFERLRLNRTALPDTGVTVIVQTGVPRGLPPAIDCDTHRCSATRLRDWDLWQWQQGLNGAGSGSGEGGLVEPTACVIVSGRRVTLEVTWRGIRSASMPARPSLCGAGIGAADIPGRPRLQMSSWVGEAHS